MITIPLLAVIPLAPMPALAAGLTRVAVLATTGILTALAVVVLGVAAERRTTRILFRHHAAPRRASIRPAA